MNIKWCAADTYFSLEFDHKVYALSSAILNGGYSHINSFLNMKVDMNLNGENTDFPPPDQTIEQTASNLGLKKPVSGMMTAATMNSFKYAVKSVGSIDVFCFLTSGLSNSLAAGDRGIYAPQQFFSNKLNVRFGTINIAAGFSIPLSDAALAEALMIVTEAKSSVLFDLGVKSSESERQATGTGTDSAIIFCSEPDDHKIDEKYCGKHTVLGETLASVVITALKDSLKGDRLFQ